MREIKFRQAIFKDGKFHHWHYWGYVGHDGEFVAPVKIWQQSYPPTYEIKDSQQYTGLDSGDLGLGGRIYEGDIVVPFYTVAGYGSKQVVRWGIGAWEPFNSNCDSDHTDRYEIIGNIHQNPELREEVGKEVS